MATHAIIASKFMALESSSWLFTGFMLASTATQTTFGQLSDIFGRKPLIMLSYLVFGLGWYVLMTIGSRGCIALNDVGAVADLCAHTQSYRVSLDRNSGREHGTTVPIRDLAVRPTPWQWL